MDATKPHILVVDDEMGPRESLKMILNPLLYMCTLRNAADKLLKCSASFRLIW